MGNKKIFKFITTIVIVFSFAFLFQININSKKAEAAPSNSITKVANQKTFNIDSDVVFRGVFSSHSWFFDVDKWWSTNEVTGEITFSINQVVQKGVESYLTFSVNDVPFKSEKIAYNPKEERQTLRFTIPKKLFKEGSNKFTVNAYARVSDLPCVDDVNPANWLDIFKDSKIVVKYNEVAANNDIANFPYPFIKENDSKDTGTAIVIPDKYSDSDLESAFMLNAYLSSIYKNNSADSNYNQPIIKYSDISKYKDYNLIYIGEKDTLPNELKSQFNGVDDGNFKDGSLIKIINSPYSKNENTKVLSIVSNNTAMMKKAVKFMMNDNLVSQLFEDQYIVNGNTEELDKAYEPSNEVTFKSLGYDDILLKGPFRRTANLNYYIPRNKVLANGGKIKLNMRYSQNLDFDRSLVSVYINGIPIGSKKLTMDNANGDSVELTIPNDVKDTSYLNIQIAFDLEMQGQWCQKREEQTPWAVVTGDSYLYLPSSEELNYYFDKYPNPFIKNNQFNNTLLVVPTSMTSDDISTIGNMVAYWGKDLKYNNGDLFVKAGSKNLGDEKDSHNLVVYGTPENNPFIKELNKDLWFKYNNDFTGFESNEKLYLTSPFNSQITTYQLCDSPFNKQFGMLVLTSPDNSLLNQSINYFLTSDKVFELNGDSEVIDKFGNIKSFVMKAPKDKPIFEQVNTMGGKEKILLMVLVVIAIILILSVLLFVRKYRKLDGKKKKNKNDIESRFKDLFKKK